MKDVGTLIVKYKFQTIWVIEFQINLLYDAQVCLYGSRPTAACSRAILTVQLVNQRRIHALYIPTSRRRCRALAPQFPRGEPNDNYDDSMRPSFSVCDWSNTSLRENAHLAPTHILSSISRAIDPFVHILIQYIPPGGEFYMAQLLARCSASTRAALLQWVSSCASSWKLRLGHEDRQEGLACVYVYTSRYSLTHHVGRRERSHMMRE